MGSGVGGGVELFGGESLTVVGWLIILGTASASVGLVWVAVLVATRAVPRWTIQAAVPVNLRAE